jgi:hypothetical protein
VTPHQIPSKTARFEHDCEKCVYLGRDREFDVYTCAQGGFPTVILRYGNEFEEYHSGAHLIDRLPEPMQTRAATLMQDWRA